MQKIKGFTLLEVLVVIAIIGIFAAMVNATYSGYLIKTNRDTTHTKLLEIGSQLQRYKMVNNTYAGANPIGSSNSLQYPDTAKKPAYTITLTLSNSDQDFLLKATPNTNTAQAGDGVICLNQSGIISWSSGVTTCDMTANATWDSN